MLKFILGLSFWQGVILTTVTVGLSGLVVILVAKKYLSPHIEKQHEKIGRLLFRVTASLIAFLISLSYANERVAQSKIMDTLEQEASLIGVAYLLLEEFDSQETEQISSKLTEYISYTIDDKWEAINSDPYYSSGTQSLREAYSMVLSLTPSSRKEQIIQTELLGSFDRIIQLMQVRIYSNPILMPNLIYILCIGMVFMWIFYSVYKIDVISLGFISLYNLFLGVLLYFVFALSNPLTGPMKINAHAFEIIQEKALDPGIK
jgi:hypothetical protein